MEGTNAYGVTALGFKIAKHLEGDDLLEKKTKKNEPTSITTSTTTTSKEDQPAKRNNKRKKIITTTTWTKKSVVDGGGKPQQQKKRKNASWMALVEGVTLYATCLILPSLIGMIVNRDDHHYRHLRHQNLIMTLLPWGEEIQTQICSRSAWICWYVFGMRVVLPPSAVGELGMDGEPILPDAVGPITFAKDFVAPDTYLSDICVVVVLTLSLALCRVLLVHFLVPNNLAPQQMEALVRCKSLHLLSNDYKQSLTPRSEKEVITFDSLNKEFGHGSTDRLLMPPSLPPLFPTDGKDYHRGLEPRMIMEPPLSVPAAATTTNNNDNNALDSFHHQQQQLSALRKRLSSNDLGLSIDDTPVDQVRPTITVEPAASLQMGGFLQACGPRGGGGKGGNFDDTDDDDLNSDQHLLVDDSENDYTTTATRRPQMSLAAATQQEEEAFEPSSMYGAPHGSPHIPFSDRAESPPPSPMPFAPGEEEEGGGGWKRRGSTASLAAAAAAAVQEDEDDEEEEDHHHNLTRAADRDVVQTKTTETGGGAQKLKKPKPQRLFAAPRYATAVFRLLYCTMSCAMAWYLFGDSDWWPKYVGGHGSTTKCWDLSGSLAITKNLDSDFDHRNTVLRRFFLVQASYHLHSGAFHVFSVVLLHFLQKDDDDDGDDNGDDDQKGKKGKKGWLSLLVSFIHVRAMLKHSLSLFFLSVSYIFSSLRRLGAIGMFGLDISSWTLHLLQTCLNAPADSVLNKPKVIKGVWALVVLPSFLYFRFWVWTKLGGSALVESNQWLAQLEGTLVPGSALWFRRIFQLWMYIWMAFHAIHFKRLVFHPHIQRIMGTNNEQRLTQAEKTVSQ